jgi:hypothetical protein
MTAPLKVNGVGRDAGHDCFVSVAFSRRPTDGELRAFHDAIRGMEKLSNIMGGLWRSAEDQVLELAKVLQAIAEEPVNWNTTDHHYYAGIVGRFQLLADGILKASPPIAAGEEEHDKPYILPGKPIAAGEITYPPEMLPSPDEGQEADVSVQNDDGSMRKVWSSDAAGGGED